jgi:hypothetical protein
VIALLLLQMTPIGEAYELGDELLAPSDASIATAVFNRVCLAPFPDAAAFEDALTKEPEAFTAISSGETGEFARKGNGIEVVHARGGVWASQNVNVRYIADGSLAPDAPQPQCKVTVRLAVPPDHNAIAKILGSSLGLTNPTEMDVHGYTRTYWDIAKGDGTRWRVGLKSETGKIGNFMSVSLLKLKDK